jgi:hypothetical protein
MLSADNARRGFASAAVAARTARRAAHDAADKFFALLSPLRRSRHLGIGAPAARGGAAGGPERLAQRGSPRTTDALRRWQSRAFPSSLVGDRDVRAAAAVVFGFVGEDRAMVERFRAGSIVVVIVTLGGVAGAAPRAEPQAKVPALNAKVIEFAQAQRGKKVGDGSCLTLAVKALEHAGAVRYPLSRADGDYVWGRRIEQFRDALPGDILQFRDA